MIKKYGSAHWTGGIKDGKGQISTESGALKDQPYGFNTRFEGKPGSNPEELVGAAHAACFSMALSKELGDAGIENPEIATKATIGLDKEGDGFAVKTSHLDVTIKAPGADIGKVQQAAEGAKANCPLSKLLNAEITMDATYDV
ncbi:OsmC family protein [Parvularcula dongshanensis]|uniref:Osmotically inducible protein OsmC n=1 Tax=Parvularcula dongshanensis TaxID=1173995 RepID=A0A840I7R5_9PROT|nr:OsmC family protein [Parvularcula dongshanensis]MBB4660303.1 osmotically inducible protein OsmC [Parvularcula dongshanensis]